MSFHKDKTLDDIHALPARVFANIAARDADTAFSGASANVNKVVRVDSPLAFYILLATTPTWETISNSTGVDISCKVTKSAVQTISDNTLTIITWDQEDYDTDGMHDNVTNNSRITIKTAGKYSVMVQGAWTSDTTGLRDIQIMKNSATLGRTRYSPEGNGDHVISAVDDFAVNDILEVEVRQTSGGNLDFRANITYFEAHKIN